MNKTKASRDNVIDIIEQLYQYLEGSEFYHYEDAEDMELAKKEVLGMLDKVITRQLRVKEENV